MSPKRKRKRSLGRPSRCACGGPKIYAECCKPFHKGELPPTPSLLMKSRYTAYALGLVDYIIDTTDPEGDRWEDDAEAWRDSIAEFSDSFEFRGVTILDSSVNEDSGMVHFRAELVAGATDASFEEKSLFRREEGRWLYTTGDVQPG